MADKTQLRKTEQIQNKYKNNKSKMQIQNTNNEHNMTNIAYDHAYIDDDL